MTRKEYKRIRRIREKSFCVFGEYAEIVCAYKEKTPKKTVFSPAANKLFSEYAERIKA